MGVANCETPLGPISTVLDYPFSKVSGAQDDLVQALLSEVLKQVLHIRATADRHEHFRAVRSERPETSCSTTAQHKRSLRHSRSAANPQLDILVRLAADHLEAFDQFDYSVV